MVALSSQPLIASGSAERRPAIWPWLVMPLVTLAMFFALFRLHQDRPYEPTGESASSAAADTGNL